MTLDTPAGPVVLADSIRELSAYRYLLFNQAWARENGLGTDLYAVDSHLLRVGLFMANEHKEARINEYNNLLLGLHNLMQGADAEHLQAAVLAPLIMHLAGQPRPDVSPAGLLTTATALLATGLTQGALADAVEGSKKNFKRN